MNIILTIMLMACSTDKVDSQDNQVDPEGVTEEVSMSECGQTVLEEGTPTAFDQCFTAEGETAFSCETCGYYPDVALSQGAFDCITCFEGYEIDVMFDDCTGFCVPEGTAEVSITTSECTPVSDCVRE
jgi:hypothetical protein